ncbi:MAG: hypothetical protein M3Z24_03615 [Chloroflexota bacterium]|nr:hypothetical protein [Chloroflexota bacterium]
MSKPRYGVDVLKVELPINPAFGQVPAPSVFHQEVFWIKVGASTFGCGQNGHPWELIRKPVWGFPRATTRVPTPLRTTPAPTIHGRFPDKLCRVRVGLAPTLIKTSVHLPERR